MTRSPLNRASRGPLYGLRIVKFAGIGSRPFSGLVLADMCADVVMIDCAALKNAGLTVNDLDVVEANEAFAALACTVSRDLMPHPAKVNPNGLGISLDHPIGANGMLITVKALHELQRIQGISAIFERM